MNIYFRGQRLYTQDELDRRLHEERVSLRITEGVLDRLVEDLEEALEHWDWWARAYGRDPAPESRDKQLLCEKHIYDINYALGREG